MPSVEIVCIVQDQPLDFGDLPFAVEAETALISHRRPSLFQRDFDQLGGCIYHLGNPGLKEPDAPGAYFAWDLLSVECHSQGETFLQFASQYAGSVRLMMEKLLVSSPAGRLVFTSDHPFGPPIPIRSPEINMQAFWSLHDFKAVRMNALYPIAAILKRPGS